MDWGSFSLDLSGATGNATKGVGLLTGEGFKVHFNWLSGSQTV